MDKLFTKYGKTIRGLLSSVNFDDLVSLILSDKDSVCALSKFKEAYDILLQTPSSEKYGKIHIARNKEDIGMLCAYDIEGCNWEDIIDGDIYLEDGPPVTYEMMAYTILWHLTFYGYDDRSKEDAYREITSGSRYDNRYSRLAFDTEVRRDWLLADAKTRKDIMTSVESNRMEGWMSYALTEEQWNAIEYHRTHCNGPKRKRDARLLRRTERLDKRALCENTLNRLLEGQKGTFITRNDLSFLSKADCRCGCEFQSHSNNESSRLQYITDLIQKYNAIRFDATVDSIAIRIATSSGYPITDQEQGQIIELARKYTGARDITICKAEDNNLAKEIFVMIVGAVIG